MMHNSDFVPALKPSHPDLKSCEDWLATAPMGDPRQACTTWLTLLGSIADAPPPRQVWQQMMEALLPRLLSAVSEQTQRFATRPLPLAPAEECAFAQVNELWLALLRTYRHLLRAAVDAGDSPETLALPASRAITCASELIAACLLARREISPELWQWLHVTYAFAEARDLADLPLSGHPRQTCSADYAYALLLALAQPQALSRDDAFWARTWARRFANLVRLPVELEAVPDGDGTHAYAVNLGGNAGPLWRPTRDLPRELCGSNTPLRFLDTRLLAQSLRKHLRQLESGEHPASLGLGERCSQPGAGALLRRLLRAWCSAPSRPQYPRRCIDARHARASSAVGLAAAHRAVSGKPLVNEVEVRHWHYTRREFEPVDGHPAQHPATIGNERQSRNQPPGLELWHVLDHSAFGFRLRATGASRIAHRQLLALQAGGSPQFLLAEVRWLMQSDSAGLSLGVQAFPGLPQACAARPLEADRAGQQNASPAFLLPGAHGASPSLILPAGWYQRDRLLELRLDEKVMRVRLTGLLDRGYDYDRTSYDECS